MSRQPRRTVRPSPSAGRRQSMRALVELALRSVQPSGLPLAAETDARQCDARFWSDCREQLVAALVTSLQLATDLAGRVHRSVDVAVHGAGADSPFGRRQGE